MEAPAIGLFIAFTAGLLSFLSPCVLPLVPSYITFITGLSIDELESPTVSARRTALVHGLLFTLGFSLIFIVLGALASGFGQLMIANRGWISQVGGVVIIVFGLYLMGILNIGLLSQDKRLHLSNKPVGYAGTVFVGIAFGAGWTPCIGPILGTILMAASVQESLGRGVVLLTAYSLGLAIPFVLSAIAVDRFMSFFRRVRRQMGWLSRGTGLVMVCVGLLMVTNRFTMLAGWLNRFTPDFLLERL
ncbi:MAG: sulfite exporter TauE/SafE family protein [Cytophagaceae bacterium]|nr:sulfite exporter TauE/SafE family protein [Gemmatimonadaceae bacterium]